MRRLALFLLSVALLTGVFAADAQEQDPSSPFDMAPERGNKPVNPPAELAPPPPSEPTPTQSETKAAPPSSPDTPAPGARTEQQEKSAFDRPIIPVRRLVLEGEIDSRAWNVMLTKNQAASAASLSLGYKASVVVAPESSRLTLYVNNQAVFDTPITASEAVGKLSADLPAGLLKAGPNLFRLQVTQRHRTDCTIASTYELRTEIDSDATALHFRSPSAQRLSQIDELASIAPDFDGLTHLRIIAPSLGQKTLAKSILRFSQAAAILIGMPSQDIEVLDKPDGPADPVTLTAVIGTAETLRGMLPSLPAEAASRPAVTFIDDKTLGPSTLVVSGPSVAAVEQAIEAIAKLADRPKGQVREVLDTSRWFVPSAPQLLHAARMSLSSLGVATEEFDGRRYKTEFQIGIPSDFYSAASGEATLLLDAAYSNEVLPGSHLDIFINGDIAATAPLSTSGGEILRHLPIRIPMTHLRPGPNRIRIEAQLLTAADAECVAGPVKGRSRFALFDSSEFVMPDYARIAQLPNLAALQGTAFPYNLGPDATALVLSNNSGPVMSTAATILGRMAVSAGRLIDLDLNPASLDDRNALFIAPAGDLPEAVAAQLNIDELVRTAWKPHDVEAPQTPAVGGNALGPVTASALPLTPPESADTQETFDRWRSTLASQGGGWSGNVSAFGDWLQRTFQVSTEFLRIVPSKDVAYLPSRDSIAMIAEGTSPSGGKVWTLVTAPNDSELRDGSSILASGPQWTQLRGRLITYNARLDEVQSEPVTTSSFLPTQPFSLSNIRLIAANWLSQNLLAFALLLFAACLLLGLSTAFFLARVGRRNAP